MTAKDAAIYDACKTHLPEAMDVLLVRADVVSGAQTWICPACGSGSGEHHTGCGIVPDDTTHWHCFACGQTGDIFDLYELSKHLDSRAARIAALAQFGNCKRQPQTEPTKKKETPADAVQAAKNQAAAYLAHCHLLTQDAGNAYLASKHLPYDPADGLLLDGEQLIVTYVLDDDTPVGWQAVQPDGRKDNPAGMSLYPGQHHVLPPKQGDGIIIAEGIATALAVWHATGLETWSVGMCSNILPCAKIARNTHPAATIYIAGDNDMHLVAQGRENLGKFKMLEAAKAVAGIPCLCPPINGPTKGTDFADIYKSQGVDATKTAFWTAAEDGKRLAEGVIIRQALPSTAPENEIREEVDEKNIFATPINDFPMDVFTNEGQQLIIETAKAKQCSPVMAAWGYNMLLSAVTGNYWRATITRTWKANGVLWNLLLADSADSKTPVYKKFTAPLNKVDNILMAEQKEKEKLLQAGEDKKKEKAPRVTAFVTSGTPEGLTQRCAATPGGFLFGKEESENFINHMDRYSAGGGTGDMMTMLCSAHDGVVEKPALKVAEETACESAWISLSMCLQTAFFSDHFNQKHRTAGFLQRFNIWLTEDTDTPPFTGFAEKKESDALMDKFAAEFKSTIDKIMSIYETTGEFHPFDCIYEPDAAEYVKVKMNELIQIRNDAKHGVDTLDPKSPMPERLIREFGATIRKFTETFNRNAICLHHEKIIVQGQTAKNDLRINLETVKKSWKLTQWQLLSTRAAWLRFSPNVISLSALGSALMLAAAEHVGLDIGQRTGNGWFVTKDELLSTVKKYTAEDLSNTRSALTRIGLEFRKLDTIKQLKEARMLDSNGQRRQGFLIPDAVIATFKKHFETD